MISKSRRKDNQDADPIDRRTIQALKQLAAREGKTVAELVCQAVDQLIRSQSTVDPGELRRRALAAMGKFHSGDENLSAEHDRHAAEAFES